MNQKIVFAIAETIRELGTIPSGHLYAQVMRHLTLDQYNAAIGILKGAGVVEEKAFLLTWVGPAKAAEKAAS